MTTTKMDNHKGCPVLPQRKNTRLKGYNYSLAGLYFITICTNNRLCLFGEIVEGNIALNDAGEMVAQQWHDLTDRFDHIRLHEFIVMPNHCHGIIEITVMTTGNDNENGQRVGVPLVGTRSMHNNNGQPQGIAPTVGDVVGAFKSLSTNEYINNVNQHGWQRFDKKLWQRNYYEHIIRNEDSYLQIAEYIQTNAMKWHEDKYYIQNPG